VRVQSIVEQHVRAVRKLRAGCEGHDECVCVVREAIDPKHRHIVLERCGSVGLVQERACELAVERERQVGVRCRILHIVRDDAKDVYCRACGFLSVSARAIARRMARTGEGERDAEGLARVGGAVVPGSIETLRRIGLYVAATTTASEFTISLIVRLWAPAELPWPIVPRAGIDDPSARSVVERHVRAGGHDRRGAHEQQGGAQDGQHGGDKRSTRRKL
jgi:hypothetical protein